MTRCCPVWEKGMQPGEGSPGLVVEGVRLVGRVGHLLGNGTGSAAVDSLVCDPSERWFT